MVTKEVRRSEKEVPGVTTGNISARRDEEVAYVPALQTTPSIGSM